MSRQCSLWRTEHYRLNDILVLFVFITKSGDTIMLPQIALAGAQNRAAQEGVVRSEQILCPFCGSLSLEVAILMADDCFHGEVFPVHLLWPSK